MFTLENWIGISGILVGGAALFGIPALVPFIDRQPRRTPPPPQDRLSPAPSPKRSPPNQDEQDSGDGDSDRSIQGWGLNVGLART